MRKMMLALFSWMVAIGIHADIRVLPVEPTPEPNQVEVTIVFPESGALKTSNPILQFRLDGFPVGENSAFPRSKEIRNSTEGQCLAVFIDNFPPLYINESLVDALDDTTYYYEQTLETRIPYKLIDGMHLIRAFPVRSYQESLKGDNAFAMDIFYMNMEKGNTSFLQRPLLTYNQPRGNFRYRSKRPILLDFYITNCQLSRDGYKVRLTIDDTSQRFLTAWVPYYIYGLKPGSHKIRLELLDPKDKLVPGAYNDVTHTIQIK
jgi:hypothetical protein